MATKIDISETREAKALDAEVIRLHAIYEEVAAQVSVAWKKAGRPRDGGYFDAKSPAYAAYTNLVDEKQEAYNAWQRAASRHGHFLNPPAERA